MYKDNEFESTHSDTEDQTEFETAISMALDLAKEYGSLIILGEKPA